MVSVGMPPVEGDELAPEDDWPAQVAGSIENVVGTVRDKTTGPALLIARALVYGMFGVTLSIAALVLFIVASVRILDNYLPSSVFGDDHTWVAHMVVGLVFTIAGAVLWRRRLARA